MRKDTPKFIPRNFKLVIKRSKAGRGLFTLEQIPKGVCIIEYTGIPATKAQLESDKGKYLFEINKNLTIDGNIPSNKARFINHSCSPNCEVEIYKKRIYIFSKRSIKPGEELNYDYDTEYFDTHIKPKGCICSKCSGLKKK